ncbi:MAG: NUDIX hydrolase [Phycisphaerales bacterium]|nr:NUDIX hydrolase [Phycisphaerales bacterium]
MHEVLLTARKFIVERRVIAGPDGRTLTREVVVHPGAVVILPILDERRIVMIRNFRHSVGEELLELPAGTCEPGESIVETARRELIEETGYRARSVNPLGEFYASPGVMTEMMHAFVATDLEACGQALEPDERIVPEIVELARVRRMLSSAELRDGKTIATLGLYFARMS